MLLVNEWISSKICLEWRRYLKRGSCIRVPSAIPRRVDKSSLFKTWSRVDDVTDHEWWILLAAMAAAVRSASLRTDDIA